MGNKIHIVGAGIIGLCSAWYLHEAGFDVTIIDKGEIKEGTSTGNAGMIVPSHFVPLAAPGVISQGIRWMFNSKSPFFIKPRLNADLMRWLWKFYKSCNQAHVDRSMHWLRDYNVLSRDLYGAFAQNKDFDFCFEKKGLLMLFQSKQQQEEEWKHAEKASKINVRAEVLDSHQVKALDPSIKIDALGAVYYPEDAHLYPNLFIQQITSQLEKKGVKFLRNTEISSIEYSSKSMDKLIDSEGNKHKINKVLFTTGSWTAKLLKKAKVKMLLQDGKGYSVTLQNSEIKPQIPTILCESKVAVTPMGNDLRIGGTLEISNLSNKINKARLQGVLESMPRYYPDFDITQAKQEKVWHGFRPCTPTGLPYLGKLDQYHNAFVATGHGMMGMSLGPATGLLMSEIISDKTSTLPIDLLGKI